MKTEGRSPKKERLFCFPGKIIKDVGYFCFLKI